MEKSKHAPPSASSVAENSSPSFTVHDVARQLFSMSWHPKSAINAETIARDCYQGAEAFCRVAAARGDTVQDGKPTS